MACPQVCSGALLQCCFGVAPSMLNVLPLNRTLLGGMPAATLQDHLPLVNILPFGLCSSLANPSVAAATAAALGVLTPMPCIPVTSAPWIPGGAPSVLLGGSPVLNSNGMLMCNWGGLIKVAMPGQVNVLVP
ncbi:DUF4280 domain-containing protein [Stutzerimonas kirkiae]|uniref:DUF4280 domain-containing protein n=1 Tax=Stutzerimonas kirkiae TaxID=2211392 RepID=A0A4Q9R2A7_9GAMM|nr:DUF4280 domain-containing protein [Stutzerimonas kirkiae]TBU91646.1 DUF4280 domain-containing protein [Stutzerimonas kirkiae]TBV00627.1 DUF4280 domain-containing protein [Stutzerimonas kirkiae]TBV10821.1 DUF4280 domain-containing protein [Stutzerimonas kirkiae]TBV14606.1 DUF4280 domain-containing protein [Stutzerimonas kirkiae]